MNHREIAHLRLNSQRIGRASFARPVDAVQWLGAVQAQDYAGAKWALGVRMAHATDAAVEQAFNAGEIVRTHLLRPTWHFVTPADIRWLLALSAPRVRAATVPRHRGLGLDERLLRRSRSVFERALRGGTQLTRAELRPLLQRAGIATDFESRMSHILMDAELAGLLCSGARRGKQFTYALLDERVPPAAPLARDEALAELAHRFFASRGPATVADFARWSGLTVADARRGQAAAAPRLRHEVIEGQSYWLSPGTPSQTDRSPTAYFLSIYDEYMSGYKDRSALIAPQHAARIAALGSAALAGIIVLDGQIVGMWKRALAKNMVRVACDPFIAPARAQWRALEKAAKRYGDFLGLAVEPIITP